MNPIASNYVLNGILGPNYLKYGSSAGEFRPKSTQPDFSGIRCLGRTSAVARCGRRSVADGNAPNIHHY